ncbi:hypothetical protein ScPMuIL_009348 [Solemya velum]
MVQEVELWVSRVTAFSSQYDSNGWSASKVVGPLAVFPQYGDIRGAWAPGSIDNAQYLEEDTVDTPYTRILSIPRTEDTYDTRTRGYLSTLRARGYLSTLRA